MKATIMVLNATLKISGTLHTQNYNRTPLHEILHPPLLSYYSWQEGRERTLAHQTNCVFDYHFKKDAMYTFLCIPHGTQHNT